MSENETMAPNTRAAAKATLTKYQRQADQIVKKALDDEGSLPMYGMLRYFMGYADEKLEPVETVAGKRIRSSLLLLVAEMFGGAKSADHLAVAVELFHNFTLIHDDIEDHDALRRGRPTVWKLWGIDHGINAGDAQAFITTKHLLRAAEMGEGGASASELLNNRFMEVIEGQYHDFELTKKALIDTTVTEAAYLEMIRKKTAALIGAAVAAGGVAAGCRAKVRDALCLYGVSFGMAYQIADDMSSIWGDQTQTGKRAHGDLLERKKTYPVLYARDHGVDDLFLNKYSKSGPLTDAEATELVAALDATDACAASRAVGEKYVAQAHEAVQELPVDDDAKETLSGLVDALVHFAPSDHTID